MTLLVKIITRISFVIVFFYIQPASAHTGEKILPVRLAVTEWASAIQGRNVDVIKTMLSADFDGANSYLQRLSAIPITRVETRFATYKIEGDLATVSPIVYYPYDEFYVPLSLKVTLREINKVWKITSVVEVKDVPEELIETNYPNQHILHTLKASIKDAESGEPIYTRIHIRDANGEYWPPEGHRKKIAEGWREDVGGDVIVAGKIYAYVKANFKLHLPIGKYVLEAERGLEYMPASINFEVTDNNIATVDLTMQRWVHMKEQGWYSGDSHTHFLDPHEAMLEARGEDLNVINSLSSSGGNLITSIPHFTGAPSILSEENYIAYIAEETRHDYLGHTVLLNLKNIVYPFGWGGPLAGVHGGYDYPPMAYQADKAHAEGALVAWSHLPHPYGELPIDVALNKIDAVEAVVFGSPFEQHPARLDIGESSPEAQNPLRLWYALLNTGFDLPALGSTDKMWNTQVSGSVRTYVKVDGDFTYQSWIDGIKAGRTFISTGAMIDFSFGDKDVGSRIALKEKGHLPFNAIVKSLIPVDKIEIVVNGEVVAVKENTEQSQDFSFEGHVDVDKSSWVIARAYSAQTKPMQYHLTGTGSPILAHTSPIYVDVAGSPRTSREDAAFLVAICNKTILWAKSVAKYHNEEQRAEVVALYEKARDVYLRQLN